MHFKRPWKFGQVGNKSYAFLIIITKLRDSILQNKVFFDTWKSNKMTPSKNL